jgi:PDZ domain-containing protein
VSAPVRVDDGTRRTGSPGGRRLEARTLTMLVCGFAAVVLFSLVGLAPVPYAIMKPGPVRDTLSSSGGTPLIEVAGRDTFPTDGSLDLTTVSVFGGPGRGVDLLDVITSWLDPSAAVVPAEQLFPPDQSESDVERQNSEEMVSSQENATAAAMGELGVVVPTTLSVVGFADGADAAEQLHEGDVITAVAGTDVPDLPQLRDHLQQVEAGDPVTVTVLRDGQESDIAVTTLAGEDRQTLLGVLIDPAYDFPFDVRIQIEDIGGPSAGMMFALGIVDKLTPGAMTGGQQVAGTGTIDSSGQVGPIGGIRQKLVGAREAGTTWFLAPEANCDEVVGHVPDGLRVVRVGTLHEAREAVEAIGAGGATDLPTCSAG